MADASRRIGRAERTFYRWRSEFCGRTINQARRLQWAVVLTMPESRVQWGGRWRCQNLACQHAIGCTGEASSSALPLSRQASEECAPVNLT